ncbi:outer membrane beta-barrel protein [Hyalangium rubrum]|uniref:Outer membrane beta-barrel protein n=1 Tax=Hyalangium rubrum TaxID=3103134 RepID=A0ABU5H6D1_9BACT|nr:outer membrane beta-barrel protein [Hyalangium sp. s54d21]MDY7228434.1 outer membrane beta-barrel protein [Hyalangium sp. s54d21]
MRIRSVMGSLATAAVLFAGPALAIEAQRVDEELDFDAERAKVGLDVRVGLGGVTGELGEETDTGPLLGIAAGAQVWKALGVELGYEGQRLPISDDIVGDGEALYRHNVGLLAKAGPLIDQKWRPYVGAGVGLSYLNVSDGAETLFDNDVVSEVPLAAGVDYNFGAIFAGARATYRLMYGEGYADDFAGDADGSLFNASITLGGRF